MYRILYNMRSCNGLSFFGSCLIFWNLFWIFIGSSYLLPIYFCSQLLPIYFFRRGGDMRIPREALTEGHTVNPLLQAYCTPRNVSPGWGKVREETRDSELGRLDIYIDPSEGECGKKPRYKRRFRFWPCYEESVCRRRKHWTLTYSGLRKRLRECT